MNRENEKAMFAKKKKDNSLAGLDFNTNIHTVEKEGDTQHMIGGKTANERRELIKQVIKDGLKNGNEVYKYIPYGKWIDTIPYLTRRLYENYDILRYIL